MTYLLSLYCPFRSLHPFLFPSLLSSLPNSASDSLCFLFRPLLAFLFSSLPFLLLLPLPFPDLLCFLFNFFSVTIPSGLFLPSILSSLLCIPAQLCFSFPMPNPYFLFRSPLAFLLSSIFFSLSSITSSFYTDLISPFPSLLFMSLSSTSLSPRAPDSLLNLHSSIFVL